MENQMEINFVGQNYLVDMIDPNYMEGRPVRLLIIFKPIPETENWIIHGYIDSSVGCEIGSSIHRGTVRTTDVLFIAKQLFLDCQSKKKTVL